VGDKKSGARMIRITNVFVVVEDEASMKRQENITLSRSAGRRSRLIPGRLGVSQLHHVHGSMAPAAAIALLIKSTAPV
jgi:hypothetical protein